MISLLLPVTIFALPIVERHTRAAETEAGEIAAQFGRIHPGMKSNRFMVTGRPMGLKYYESAALTTTAGGCTIYGSLLGGGGYGDDIPYGIYSFPSTTASPVTAVVENSSLNANGGGVLVDDKYCFVNFFDTGMGGIFAYYYVYDTETWTKVRSNRVQLSSVATDLTYDPVTKKVYGCFINDTQDGYVFGVMSTDDGSVMPISALGTPLFCVAASNEGVIYAVDGTGRLIKLDKSTGDQTIIGHTGITPKYTQSATFDPKTNTLYWAAMNDTTDALYTIDTTTGAATLVGRFMGQEEFGGLFIYGAAAAASAPAAVENLAVDYDTSTTGTMTVTFTIPSSTYSGEPLSGELDYIISLNDVERIVDNAEAGTTVSERIGNTTVGEFKVAVRARNAAGDGPAETVRKWIGRDTPAAPENLAATVEGGSITLTWDAPTRGQHDGYLDASQLNYKIIRYPEARVIADRLTTTTFTDTPASMSLSAYWYDVVALSGNSEGASASTGKLLVGNAFTVPYSETFERASNFELFTVIDANADGVTWKLDGGGSASCAYSTKESMNDWLITPPIHLSKNYLYRMKMSTRSASSGWPEKIRVAVGKARTVEAMTQEIVGVTVVNYIDSRTTEAIFNVDEDADYFLGFQSVSDAQMFKLYLDDIAVEEAASLNSPASVADLTVTAGELGAKSATVTFTAPAVTLSGEPLTTVPRITLRRGNAIIKTFKNEAGGAKITYLDEACDLGNNTYSVYASNDAGDAIEVSATVFVGPDKPGEPCNVLLKEVNGKAVLTWDAPAAGMNGGYVDSSKLTYHILFGNDENTVIAMNVNGTSYTFDPVMGAGQYAQKYIVFAVNDKGIGYGTASNIIVFGTPYNLPFKESFADASVGYDTWGIIDDDLENSGTWEVLAFGTMPSTIPQDNDGGLLTFVPMYAGDEAYLYSGKIDVSKAVNPELQFYFFYPNGSQNELIVEATTNGYEFNAIEDIKMTDYSGSSEWKKVTVPLSSLKTESGYIQLAFRAIAHDGLASTHIDNISVTDVLDYNLEATSISVPKRMVVGTEATITVKVSNVGTKAFGTGSFAVALYRDGTKVAENRGVTLLAGSSRDYLFLQTLDSNVGDSVEYYAVVESNTDENLTNNTTQREVVEVKHPHLPAPTGLTATAADGSVALAWNAADPTETVAETDDFENYEAFTISNIGDWTLADVDGQGTAYFAATWPNRGAAHAFIVFNAPAIGADYDSGYESDWKALSGDQCLISFIAEAGTTNDWLISPMLSGKEQTISFYVKGVSGYTDSYEVLTSTAESAINRASFTAIAELGGTAPAAWTKVEFTVPAGTTYFAIRHTASVENGFALLIDDATFQAKAVSAPTLLGYNIYRNGVKLNAELIAECSYTDNSPIDGAYYNATAVYSLGESAFSNAASVGEGGAELAECSAIGVTGGRGTIEVRCQEGSRIGVFAASGMEVLGCIATDRCTTIGVAQGVYLVKVANTVHKVVVKP